MQKDDATWLKLSYVVCALLSSLCNVEVFSDFRGFSLIGWTNIVGIKVSLP